MKALIDVNKSIADLGKGNHIYIEHADNQLRISNLNEVLVTFEQIDGRVKMTVNNMRQPSPTPVDYQDLITDEELEEMMLSICNS